MILSYAGKPSFAIGLWLSRSEFVLHGKIVYICLCVSCCVVVFTKAFPLSCFPLVPPTQQKEKKVDTRVEEGNSTTLKCNPPQSSMEPIIHWMDLSEYITRVPPCFLSPCLCCPVITSEKASYDLFLHLCHLTLSHSSISYIHLCLTIFFFFLQSRQDLHFQFLSSSLIIFSFFFFVKNVFPSLQGCAILSLVSG